jgi:hypothetical protein
VHVKLAAAEPARPHNLRCVKKKVASRWLAKKIGACMRNAASRATEFGSCSDPEMQRVIVHLDPCTVENLRDAARIAQTTLGDIIRAALREYLHDVKPTLTSE